MNKKLLEILVCPYDKVSSLELIEFKPLAQSPEGSVHYRKSEHHRDVVDIEKPNISTSNDNTISNQSTGSNENDLTSAVEEGILLCKSCLRFYPITEEIPIILPDDLRDKKKDLEFLSRWKEKIPSDMFVNLKPWTL